MAVELTRPSTAGEQTAWRESGTWADRVEVDVEVLASHGERLALVDRSTALTYRSLAAEIEGLAGSLSDLGVAPGDSVVVVTDNDCPSVVATYASWFLGATVLMIHVSSGGADVAFACQAVSPSAVLLSPAASGFAGAAVAPIVKELSGLERSGLAPTPAIPDPDGPRLVVLTSGTTSRPKGVVHTANTLRASQANYMAMTDLTPEDRFFLVSPLASMAGILQVFELAPRLGAAAVLEGAWEPMSSLRFLKEHQGTFYGGTDNVLARLFGAAQQEGIDEIPIRAVAVGGTMLRRDVLDEAEGRHGITVIRVYGSSEAPNSTGARPSEPRDVRLADDGAPVPNVEVRLAGDEEELQVRGPHLFRGYIDPGDNEDAFDGDWFRTGDTAEIAGGRVRVIGRLKEIANRNGRKMSLAEIDDAFRAAAEVADCAAFAVPDDVTGDRVAMAVVGDDEIVVPDVLQAMVASGLPRWKLPESVVLYSEALPRTATGKIQRRLLTEDGGRLLWRADRLTE